MNLKYKNELNHVHLLKIYYETKIYKLFSKFINSIFVSNDHVWILCRYAFLAYKVNVHVDMRFLLTKLTFYIIFGKICLWA